MTEKIFKSIKKERKKKEKAESRWSSCSGIGGFLCAAGRSQDGGGGNGGHLKVRGAGLKRLSFSLWRKTNQNEESVRL